MKDNADNKIRKVQGIPIPECGFHLRTIYFYLTEGCNLRCRHCWINPPFEKGMQKQHPFLDFEVFKDVIQQGKTLGLRTVKLTGGEPFIHPKISKMIDYINVEDLRLNIETNGVSLTEDLVSKIRKNKKSFVSVSVDGENAETHEWVRRVPGCFDAALAGIKLLVDAKFRPQLIMSIMDYNVEQMETVVRMAEKIGCGSVKFNLVTSTGRGDAMHKSGQVLSIQKLIDLGNWVERELAPNSKIPVIYSHPESFRPLKKVINGRGKCGIFSIIGVLGTGKYALCGIGETVPELVFGHTEKDRLADIWNNNATLNEIRKGLPEKLTGICADCISRDSCKGSCVANNYKKYRKLFAPHQYCQEAFDAGLFPESRLIPGEYRKLFTDN
ncbi:MAG: SynChlorMet cassette radical SAM/SPASM protein ScmF [bacterium]|nr:SynChlorMet cassette radical SAM/SPASM protein ScmF [bacterium]